MEGIIVQKIFITSEHQKDDQSHPDSGNTDVIIVLEDGAKYTASFFTYDYIEHIRNMNMMTGEYLGGKYYWAKNMVLVEECSPEIIKPVVMEIIEEGEFSEVFRRL